MGPVMAQFGLPAEVAAAANTGDMQAFFKALENSTNPNPSSESSVSGDDKKDEKPKEEKKDQKGEEDNDMTLDW